MAAQQNHRAVASAFRALLVVAVFGVTVVDARAQRLGIHGQRFTVDGAPKFLTFVTYFGGMGAPNVIADLHLMKSLGFAGFRIWPNLDTGPPLNVGFMRRLGLDVDLFHETRQSDWYTLRVQQYTIDILRSAGKPVHMQEPMTTSDTFFFYPSHDRAEYFLQAIAHAKL